ncbi:MFS transporter [Lapillicoccus jejuensis]|uniref:Putative MFS family arabinose efflux permease n=1 Tax=Lapillicoccus jejuensis TaxID=402171 RepID=A0A542DZ65_9MICO|nr:MFS transporter [Lapillicoccus jejuensis]TQJ08224.1 putative MFS family arabinose efflux permease [Lapillicoccus jejuensis]
MPATPRSTVTVATAGTLVAMLSYTAPLGVLPTIARDVAAGPSAQSWILSASSLGLTTGLLTAGALGDDHGRRRVFVAGALVLAVGQLLGAVAPSPGLVVAGRVVQGLGSAALIACSLALISHVVPAGPERVRASGLWGAGLAGGIGVGPLLGTVMPWRLAYGVVGVAALFVALVTPRLAPESRADVARRPDVPGIVTLAGGLALLCAGLTELRTGVGALPLALLVIGLVLLAAFAAVEHRVAEPMMPLALFRSPALVAATVGALGTGLGIIAVISYLSTLAQRGLGLDPLQATLALTAWPVVSVVTSLLTRHLPERLSGAVRLVGGLVVVAAGMLLLTGLDPSTTSAHLVLATAVAGLGTGVVNATLGREAVASVPPALAGVGSGINNTSRYLGAAVGVTLVSVLTSRTGTERPAQLIANWDRAVLVAVALTVVCLLVVAVAESRSRRTARRQVTDDAPIAG